MAMLPEIGKFSSVSGGSILAGLIAVQWPHLDFQDNIAVNFVDKIFAPIWQFCSLDIDRPAVLLGLISGTWKLEQSYKKHLVGSSKLQDLPDYPHFIFNVTHIETGRNCTLTKDGLHTWRLGDIELPNLTLAKAIAASSAFPPAFPAVTLNLDADAFVKTEEYTDLFHRNDLKSRVSLTDGGAYDNLGVHAIRRCPTILVSDGSAPLHPTKSRRYTRQLNHRIMRPMEAALEQTRAIRRKKIVSDFIDQRKEGCLWYTNTDIRKYTAQNPFTIKHEWNNYLSSIRTRLNAFTDAEKSRLINWGYIMCDLSVRTNYSKGKDKEPPNKLPFPAFPFDNQPPS